MKIPFVNSIDYRCENMIRYQLISRGIHDPAVLQAMQEVPREEFVDERMKEHAYEDRPLPILQGQTISQPYIVAYMTEALELEAANRVLEIGTGSGYAAAVLSRIVTTVHTVERLAGLAHNARKRLNMLGYENIHVYEGDGSLGWPEHAPYDAIVVTAAAPDVPGALLEQLAIKGRLVIPVGLSTDFQMLVRMRRISENRFSREDLCGVRFVPLIGAEGW